MVGLLNDSQAYIDKNGNLSLGGAGVNDAAGDTTHPYAKNDVWEHIEPIGLPAAAPTTNLTESNVRSAANRWVRRYTAGGSVNSFVYIPMRQLYRTLSGQLNTRQASQPHGFKVLSMYLAYTVATADATTISVAFASETPQVNNTARAITSTTPLGAVTYENPVGTVAATLPVAQQASPYVSKVVVATPAFIISARSNLSAEINLVLPNTCVVDLTDIWFNLAYAMY